VIYGDVLFRSYILRDLIEHQAAVTVVVDSNLQDSATSGDFASCSEPDDRAMWGQAVTLNHLSAARLINGTRPDGRWTGMLRVRGEGRRRLEDALRELQKRKDFAALGLPDLLNFMVDKGQAVHVWYVHGHWLDVNSVKDLESAGTFAAGA
jgi:phosphoenolpyruvate phosphomutase